MPDAHVFNPKTGDEEIATPESDEWACKRGDVALGAPGLLEQIPILTSSAALPLGVKAEAAR